MPGRSSRRAGRPPSDAEFGAALATRPVVYDDTEPWSPAPAPVGQVAVGAPGAGRVYVYNVDTTSGAPFGLPLQVLNAPGSGVGKGFGSSLAFGDFDDDGAWDLAVGAPEASTTNPEGFVFVYRGAATGTPFPGAPLRIDGNGAFVSAGANDFGRSLAVGWVDGDSSQPQLAIGAPELLASGSAVGGVCVYTLGASGTSFAIASGNCTFNPFLSTIGYADHNFGASVAIGNFMYSDGNGDDTTDEALTDELAVGMRGYGGDAGRVDLFLTDDAGVDFATVINTHTVTTSTARYGSALWPGHVQETGWEDLAIGAPDYNYGNGWAGNTKAEVWTGCTDENLGGHWTIEDEDGDPVEIKIWSTGSASTLQFLDNFDYSLYEGEGTGDVCTTVLGSELVGNIPAGTVVPIGADFDCTDDEIVTVDGDFSTVIGSMLDRDNLNEVGQAVYDLIDGLGILAEVLATPTDIHVAADFSVTPAALSIEIEWLSA